MSTPVICLEALVKRFGATSAVDDITLEVQAGEVLVILGASGCGKTTLLRLLAGFESPDSGRILIDGADLTAAPPYERPVNLMFQSYALFPHMDVASNVGYGLRKEGLPREQIGERVREMLALVQLEGLERRRPDQLSGGQRQRVALARALVKRPRVLLLDEPLAALDRKLRERTQFELLGLQKQLGTTFVIVTHDQEEAMTLATRIAVMARGRFVQVGSPEAIYEYPATREVAQFVGSATLIPGRIIAQEGERLRLRCEGIGQDVLAPAVPGAREGAGAWLALRPEKIRLGAEAPAPGEGCVLLGTVEELAYSGARSLYRVRCEGGTLLLVSTQNVSRNSSSELARGAAVFASWDPSAGVVLLE
jgi:putrescine transport system ATP-binding protein